MKPIQLSEMTQPNRLHVADGDPDCRVDWTELHRNPAALARNGGHWRGLDDLELATCAWVGWFNEERFHGELDDLTPAEVEAAYYLHQSQASAA